MTKIDIGPQKLGDELKNRTNIPKIKPPAYQWQDLALKIINDLQVPGFKRSSVFKVCKQFPREYIMGCLSDTKELCQTGEKWKYFFKLVNGK